MSYSSGERKNTRLGMGLAIGMTAGVLAGAIIGLVSPNVALWLAVGLFLPHRKPNQAWSTWLRAGHVESTESFRLK